MNDPYRFTGLVQLSEDSPYHLFLFIVHNQYGGFSKKAGRRDRVAYVPLNQRIGNMDTNFKLELTYED